MNLRTNNDERTGHERVQKTLIKIFNGEISDLECPYCSSRPLRFSYSFVEPDNYGVWLSCTFCRKEAHLRAKERPPGFDEQYVLKEFQERSERAIKSLNEWWGKVSGQEE